MILSAAVRGAPRGGAILSSAKPAAGPEILNTAIALRPGALERANIVCLSLTGTLSPRGVLAYTC